MTAKNGKPCKRCGTSKWKNSRCIQCERDNDRCYREKNREKLREKSHRWYTENRDKARKSSRRWQQNNPEKVKENKKNWNARNRDKVREQDRHRGMRNRNKRREYKRRWRKENPDKAKSYTHRYRAAKTKAGGSYTSEEWHNLCEQYGYKCCYPGCERIDIVPDHVVPVSKGGSSNISNLQPLCYHHNSSKGAKTIDYRHKPGILHWIQKRLFD